MIKFLSQKSVLMSLILALSFSTAFGQAFWSYDFSDQTQSTADWVHGGTNAGAVTWAWTDVLAAGAYQPGNFMAPSAANGYMWFDSDGNGDNAHAVTLTGVGVPADCSGKTDVHLRFYAYLRSFTGSDVATVGVSTNGTTFTQITVPEFDLDQETQTSGAQFFSGWIDLDLDQADGQSQVWVQVSYAGQYEYYFKVDDMEMYEYTAPISPVTFTVNLSNETVAADGAFLAGSFNGWTGEAMSDNGDGTWSITKDLAVGDYEFKFLNGSGGWEMGKAACGVDDNNGGFNRTITVGDMAMTYGDGAICFNECDDCTTPATPCDMNPMAIFCDNFDSYVTSMTTGNQATWWTTWSGTLGTNEDGIVTTAQAASGANSMAIISGGGAGPQDVVLDFGTLSSGNYSFKHKFYIPTGKAAYYNIQNVVPIGAGAWNNNMDFGVNGIAVFDNATITVGEFAFPHDTWFEVEHRIDLDNDIASLWIDGQFVSKFAYPNNLGGIDYFPIDGTYSFYVDDVEFVALPPVVYDVDLCDAALDITPLFGSPAGVVNVSDLQDNTNANTEATDVAGSCWGESAVNGSLWYTFTGDGNKYHIETVPCNADTNYIGLAQQDPGDTQIAIFTGACGDLDEVGCADDLFTNGIPDWRAGLDFETDPGVDYRMLIDGFEYNNVVAQGQFCIQVEQVSSIDCAAGAVGSSVLGNNGFVCLNQSTASVLTIPNPDEFIIPNIGPVFGMVWVISTAPLDPMIFPADDPSYWGSFGVSGGVTVQGIVNDNDPLTHGIWYFTPCVIAGGVDATPATPAFLHEVDITGGCFFVGQSQQLVLLPALTPINATANIINDNGTGVGGIDITATGGFTDLAMQDANTYAWSNGATTQDIAGLTTGDYTVTISDISGCVDDAIFTFMVGTTAVEDPSNVQSLTVSPNPTSGLANLNMALENAADVRIEMVNSIGQIMMTQNLGKTQNVTTPLDFSNLSSGIYMMRVTVDGQTALRTIAINR